MDVEDTELTENSVAAAIEARVRDIGAVAEHDTELHRELDLFDVGYLDSLALVTITTFIEETYGITLTEEDLFNPNFTSIAGMAQLVTARAIPANHSAPKTGRSR